MAIAEWRLVVDSLREKLSTAESALRTPAKDAKIELQQTRRTMGKQIPPASATLGVGMTTVSEDL
jgi:hypothetical protein